MDLPTVTTLANDLNIAVALAASQYLASNPLIAYRFSEPPTLEYTNLPTRLTSLCTTPEIVRNLLDALVAVSATRAPAGNESIACALRLDPDHPTRPAVELILSSHEPVRRGTERHIRKIWKQMLAISAVPNKRNTERGAFLHLLVTFRYMVYIHTLHKLRGDFAMHMEVIDCWKGDNIADNGELSVHGCGDDAHIRELLVETLLYLERCRSAFARMREDDQVPKRLISTREDVLAVIAAMELGSQVANKLLLNTVPLQKLSMRWLGSKDILRNAFQSITSLPRHIVELLHFAMNHMESLHTHTLLLTLVSPVSVTPHVPWPQTKDTWENIREHILKDKNCTASARARHDLEDILPSPDSLAVYPELTLVTYLHALHFQPMNAATAPASSIPPAPAHPPHPQPFNYIAVTAPPCAPSALWIDAYNARHAHRGDGLRFDIALDPCVHWNTAGAGRRAWRWVPLPAVPGDGVDGAEANAGAAMRIFGRGGRGAEERIVDAAWDAYAMMAGGMPFPPKPVEKVGRRNSVFGAQKVWPF